MKRLARARRARAPPAARCRHRQARLAGQPLDRLGKAQPLGLHDEADDVAMRAAAEAVEEALVLVDREGGRLLVVERAEAGMLAPAPHQLHPAGDHAGERDAAAQLVQELRRERHRPWAGRRWRLQYHEGQGNATSDAPPLSGGDRQPSCALTARSPWRSPSGRHSARFSTAIMRPMSLRLRRRSRRRRLDGRRDLGLRRAASADSRG